jgi:carotenoid phi-ring synthase / carotenoid chi-ring synthase
MTQNTSRRGFLEAGIAVGLYSVAQGTVTGCASRRFQTSKSNQESSELRGRDEDFDGVTIWPSNPNAPLRLPEGVQKSVLIVGGGLAGLAAGMELAERGYKVTVREAEKQLGGRLSTRVENLPVGEFRVEHGLHMWFYQYYNFYEILGPKKLNVLDKYFVDFKEIYFIFETYKPELVKSEGPYPLNLLAIIAASENLNLLSAAGTIGILPEILAYNYPKTNEALDNITLDEFAKKRKVNKDFYKIILEPAASVTLNDPLKVSAGEMMMFTNLYFLGHPRAFHRKIATVDHGTAVVEPMAKYIQKFGGEVKLNSPVKGFRLAQGKIVGCVGETEKYDQVILSCDIPGAKKILASSVALDTPTKKSLQELVDGVAKMKVAPPYKVLRVWFNKPTLKSRPQNQACIETPEFLPIHLIGIFNMLEKESSDWAEKNNGSVVEYHLYNTPEFNGLSQEEVWLSIEKLAFKITPELSGAKPLAMSMGSYENFTSYEVGQATERPDMLSARGVGIANLALAGDWMRTPYPSALMEKAISTGLECVNVICAEDNVRKVTLKVARGQGPGLFPKFTSD